MEAADVCGNSGTGVAVGGGEFGYVVAVGAGAPEAHAASANTAVRMPSSEIQKRDLGIDVVGSHKGLMMDCQSMLSPSFWGMHIKE